MNRNIALCFFVFLGLSISCKEKKQEVENKVLPNIIFILADDLGYGDLSITGQKNFTTPNIDRLAREVCFLHSTMLVPRYVRLRDLH